MRRAALALLALALVLGLAACGGPSKTGGGVDPVALGEELTAKAEALPDMTVVSSATADGEDLFPYLSDMDYGKVAGYYLAYSTSGSAEEIAVIRLKDKADAAEAKASLERHLSGRLAIFRVYAPEQSAMAEAARTVVSGDTVALFVCANSAELDGAFRSAVSA